MDTGECDKTYMFAKEDKFGIKQRKKDTARQYRNIFLFFTVICRIGSLENFQT